MIVAGNKIYSQCGVCGKLVQINKPIFGSLHICLTDDEIASQQSVLPNDGEQTTKNHLAYYERMKENARQQNAAHAFGFWCGVIAVEKSNQQGVQKADEENERPKPIEHPEYIGRMPS